LKTKNLMQKYVDPPQSKKLSTPLPDTIANIKQKYLHGRYFKELEQPDINIQASHAWLKKFKCSP
jgi:hypothetical protein